MSETPCLVVGSKVKSYLKEKEMRCSASVLSELTKLIELTLDRAIISAKGDKRVTVQDKDIFVLEEGVE